MATDTAGDFELSGSVSPPLTLVFSHLGYAVQEIAVARNQTGMEVNLQPVSILGSEIVVAASRVEENLLESPVSIEKMNASDIREVASSEKRIVGKECVRKWKYGGGL